MFAARHDTLLLPLDALRLGLVVQLQLGWMDHPFPRSRFKLDDPEQIATLRRLGVREVRIRPDLSDADALAAAREAAAALRRGLAPTQAPDPTSAAAPASTAVAASGAAAATPTAPPPVHAPAARAAAPVASSAGAPLPRPVATTVQPAAARQAETADARRDPQQAQRDSLARSERAHAHATRGWLALSRELVEQPTAAHQATRELAGTLCGEMLADPDTTVRMLGETAGTAQSQHALNVSVLSLMLGRALGLSSVELEQLAVGSLLHDIGKLMLPDHLRNADLSNPGLMLRERREHVAQGVRLGMAMGLDAAALQVIAQHHEACDGSGLPQGLPAAAITLPARIVALVDSYDRLCNPPPGEPLRTPHEAQAQLFAHQRALFDPAVLAAFIKLLGVYPPGSVVQLQDERLALVVAVHPQRALRPSVMIYDPRQPREQHPVLHLHEHPSLGIRRSLHPQHLPRAVLEALSPRGRVQYHFAHEAPLHAGAAVARVA